MRRREEFRVLAIAGSLRRGSYNRGLAEAAREAAPPGVAVTLFDLAGLPFYDADLEGAGEPERVAALRRAIRGADALLLASPEYNGFMPGVLHNAIDWASRPLPDSPLRGKPVAVVGATPGKGATARAQAALRQLLTNTRALVLPEPRLELAHAANHFDADGRLTDPAVRAQLAEILAALRDWSRTQAAEAA